MLSTNWCVHAYWILCSMVRPNHCHELTTGLWKCWYWQQAHLLRTRLNWQDHCQHESIYDWFSCRRHQPDWLWWDRVCVRCKHRLWWNHCNINRTQWSDDWIQSLWGARLKTWITTPLLRRYPNLQVPSNYIHPEPFTRPHGDAGWGWHNLTTISRLFAKHYHLARGR